MSTSKLFGKDILITSTTEATSSTVGAFSTLGGINVTKTILTAGGINSISNTNTLGNLFTTGGNIGIGTTSPTQALSVEGNFNFTGNLYQNGSVYSGSTQWGSTGANIYFNTGNVGLGTLAPVGRLHMANPSTLNTNNVVFEVGTTSDGGNSGWSALNFNGYYNGSETRINTSKNRWRLYIDQRTTTDRLIFDTYNGTTLTTIMSLNSNGNVAIGNNTATRLLQVGNLNGTTQGTISINNSGEARYHLYNGGSVIEWLMGQRSSTQHNFNISRLNNNVEVDLITITSAGNVGIGTNTPNEELTIDTLGNISLTSNEFDTGKIIFGSVVSGAYNNSGRYYIQRGGTSGNMNHLIIHTPSEASNAGVNFMTTSQVSRMFINSSSGNVGIGTTAPAYTLDVNGTIDAITYTGDNISISQSMNMGGNMYLGNAATGSARLNIRDVSQNLIEFQYSTNTVGTLTCFPGVSGLRFNGGSGTNQFVLTSYGNIGIGTTSPGESLDVRGNIRVGNNSQSNYIVFFGTSNDGGSNHTYIGERIYNPSEQSELLLFKGNDATTGGGPDRIRLLSAEHRFDTFTTSNVLAGPFENIATHGSTRMIIATSGNIGIGTTSPVHPLMIGTPATQGSVSVRGTNDTRYHVYNNAGVAEWLFGQKSSARSDFTFTKLVSGAETDYLTITTGGNIGIGTTSPSSTLQVNGAITHGGGYGVFGLSTGTYAAGTTQMSFANVQFSSRITNSGNFIVLQDAGIYIFMVKLNSDTSVTSNLSISCQFWNGTSWVGYQSSEDSRAFNNQVDFSTQFMVQASANQSWALFLNNGSGANWSFSVATAPDYWSRWMVYKVA